MKRRRYPGLASFDIEDAPIFAGRREEINLLSESVYNKSKTLLYGKSGLGKTSLINAGVIPQLNKKGILPQNIFLIRFNNYDSKNFRAPIESFHAAIQNKLSRIDQDPFAELVTTEPTVWLILKEYIHLADDINGPLVLIFDQFEELDTYPDYFIDNFVSQLSKVHYNDFKKEVKRTLSRSFRKVEGLQEKFESKKLDLFLYEDLDIHILFSIRKDRLDFVKEIQGSFSGLLNENNSFELTALNYQNACKAIVLPAQVDKDIFELKPFSYDEDLVENIINSLSTSREKAEIESFQLQIVCSYIEQLIIDQKEEAPQITRMTEEVFLEDHKNIEDKIKYILNNHYEQEITKIFDEKEQLLVRKLIEDELISSAGDRRLSRDREIIIDFLEDELLKIDETLNDEALNEEARKLISRLESTRIIRAQANTTKGINYEISHDTLLKPILESKNTRISSENYISSQIEKAKVLEEEGIENIKQSFLKLAIKSFKKAYDIVQMYPEELEKQLILKIQIGRTFTKLKEFARAEENMRVALDLSQKLNSPESEGKVYEAFGSLERERYNVAIYNRKTYGIKEAVEPKVYLDGAINYYKKAGSEYEKAKSYFNYARMIQYLGYIEEEEDRYDTALDYYRESKKILAPYGEVFGINMMIQRLTKMNENRLKGDEKPWGYIMNLISKEIHELTGIAPIEIGRNTNFMKSNKIPLSSQFISRKHLKINNMDHTIEDQRSRNGTTVNGRILPYGMTYALKDFDVFVLANEAPFQFFNEKPEIDIVPDNYWGLFMTEIKTNCTYLDHDEYFISLDSNGKLKIQDKEIGATIIKFRYEDTRIKFYLNDQYWNLIEILKSDDYNYSYSLLPVKQWIPMTHFPIQFVYISDRSKNDKITSYGPTFQIISRKDQ